MNETSDFLYPFIEGDETDADTLLVDLATSADAKARLSAEVTGAALAANGDELAAAAAAMAERFAAGATLFAFGNGGSSTDAGSLAALFARPPWDRPLPARSLATDTAVLTAIGNDVGFELVFVRQLIAHGHPGDIAVALSTSGSSHNLLAGLAEARRRGMLTVGLAGYDGGEMARAGLGHCLVVASDSVHRIQEAQAALAFALWTGVQHELASEEVRHG